jgi:hypothetical protein
LPHSADNFSPNGPIFVKFPVLWRKCLFRFCVKAPARTWKAKYPTQEAIDRKRDELGDIGFRREMLLQVVPEEGQDIFPEDIHYYDDPPFDDGNHLAHGVDLAISTKENADYTAIVSGEVTWPGGNIENLRAAKPDHSAHDVQRDDGHARQCSQIEQHEQ